MCAGKQAHSVWTMKLKSNSSSSNSYSLAQIENMKYTRNTHTHTENDWKFLCLEKIHVLQYWTCVIILPVNIQTKQNKKLDLSCTKLNRKLNMSNRWQRIATWNLVNFDPSTQLAQSHVLWRCCLIQSYPKHGFTRQIKTLFNYVSNRRIITQNIRLGRLPQEQPKLWTDQRQFIRYVYSIPNSIDFFSFGSCGFLAFC